MTDQRFSSDSYQNVLDRPGKKWQLPRVEHGDEGAAAMPQLRRRVSEGLARS